MWPFRIGFELRDSRCYVVVYNRKDINSLSDDESEEGITGYCHIAFTGPRRIISYGENATPAILARFTLL